jgi:tRNA1(Val) A37 N6-methylase TrmN6
VEKESIFNQNDYKTIARHEINLDLDSIFKIARKLLKNNGVIAIVHRPERLIEIIETMKKYNIEPKKIQFIYPKKEKDSNTILIEGAKNGSSGLKVLKPLYVHDEKGNYLSDIKNMFE